VAEAGAGLRLGPIPDSPEPEEAVLTVEGVGLVRLGFHFRVLAPEDELTLHRLVQSVAENRQAQRG
jgi:hypothetical protein